MATRLTAEQIARLQELVSALVTARSQSEAKTQAAAMAASAAEAAIAVRDTAQGEETAADQLVTSGLTDLSTFVDTLTDPAPTPPPAE